MKKIGILFGMENSFPPALVEHINARKIDGIHAPSLSRPERSGSTSHRSIP